MIAGPLSDAQIAELVENTVTAWKEMGKPLTEMDGLEMTGALAKRLGLVTTPVLWAASPRRCGRQRRPGNERLR